MAQSKKTAEHAGRLGKKPSHVKRLARQATLRNKVRRELKNMRENPADVACFNRLVKLDTERSAPADLWKEISAGVEAARKLMKVEGSAQ